MPTTDQESRRIIEITTKYMPLDHLEACFVELDERVGQLSENDSVKQSFAMFRAGIEKAQEVRHDRLRAIADDPRDAHSFTLIMWLILVGFHHFLVIGNVVSFFVIPFIPLVFGPWYLGFLAFPACFSIIWVTCSPVNCCLTDTENKLRFLLGWMTIRSFIGHYYVKTFYRLRARFRAPPCSEPG